MKRTMLAVMTALMLAAALGCGGALAERAAIPEIEDIWQLELPQGEAFDFTRSMKAGWNLGNTFDTVVDSHTGDEMALETLWCGVETTEDMIEALHQAGFKTLRLPVSWHQHVDENFVISEPWLARVQQVADWALERDMYVIINTHHDVYPEYYYPSSRYAETSDRYMAAIWGQLAERFRDYDQRLIFESMNEPRLKDTKYEWNVVVRNADCQDAFKRINALNQIFVDTVRAAGGENADRYLMVPPYAAAAANLNFFELPRDTAENRLIVSIHAYTPYAFALDAGGTDSFSWQSKASTKDIETFLNLLYNKFIKNGIPVVIGEFGARAKNNNLQDRVEFTAYYVASAAARGIPCCWWDNNAFAGSGENFGVLRRKNATWVFPEIVEAMMRYAPAQEEAPLL